MYAWCTAAGSSYSLARRSAWIPRQTAKQRQRQWANAPALTLTKSHLHTRIYAVLEVSCCIQPDLSSEENVQQHKHISNNNVISRQLRRCPCWTSSSNLPHLWCSCEIDARPIKSMVWSDKFCFVGSTECCCRRSPVRDDCTVPQIDRRRVAQMSSNLAHFVQVTHIKAAQSFLPIKSM